MASPTTSATLQIPTTETTPSSGLPTSSVFSSLSGTVTSSSSTTSDSITSISPTSTPPVNNNNGQNGGNGLSNDDNIFGNSANYFFGFLITFVVLLAIFLTCGCISRRRMIARRQAGLPPGLWGRIDRAQQPVEPNFVEPWLSPEKTSRWEAWRSIKPLAASIVSEKPTDDEQRIHPPGPIPVPVTAPRPPSPTSSHYTSLLSISSWVSRIRRRGTPLDHARNQPPTGKAPEDIEMGPRVDEPSKPTMIQVTTMIAMPCNAAHGQCSSSRQVYEFGLTQVPYAVGKIPTTTTSLVSSSSISTSHIGPS